MSIASSALSSRGHWFAVVIVVAVEVLVGVDVAVVDGSGVWGGGSLGCKLYECPRPGAETPSTPSGVDVGWAHVRPRLERQRAGAGALGEPRLVAVLWTAGGTHYETLEWAKGGLVS